MARFTTMIGLLGLLSSCTAASDPAAGGDDDLQPDAGEPGHDGGGGETPDGGGEEPEPDVLPTYPTEHPRIYLGTQRARLEASLTGATPAAVRFRDRVDQWIAGANIWGFQVWNAALLGQLTGNPSYCARAVSAIDAQVGAAEAAIAAGERPEVSFDSYLHIGELVGDLALVYDWCFDATSAAQRTRWLRYANQAIWNVWHPAQATWGGKAFPWSGWSTTNPSNNYYYSFLRATMLVGLAAKGESAQADEWVTLFRDTKIFGELVPTFESDLVGGGSREGTGYGVAMRNLFELYDLWKATTGEKLATKTGHTRASLRAFMHQIVPTLDRFAPTGDQARDPTAVMFDYHRAYLAELAQTFPTDALAGRAKALLQASSVPRMSQGFMYAYDFLYDTANVTHRALEGLGPTYHAKGIGQLYSRSSWEKSATWINLIAGPYTESHAHQDQGSLMIYKGGWLAHDAVVHSRSGLTQETTAHGLVRIDSGGTPVRQVASTVSRLEALHAGDRWVYAAADLTPAYKGHAAIQLVQRELVYLQPDVVVVYDRVRSAAGTSQTWQLPTPVVPALSGTAATITNAGHTLRVDRIAAPAGTARVHDYRSSSEFVGGYRLDFTAPGGDQRYLHVLGIDGAVLSSTPAGANGVTLALRDGRTVTVQFARDAIGATLVVDGITRALAPGVDALPD